MFWANVLTWIGTHDSWLGEMPQIADACGLDYARVLLKVTALFDNYEDLDCWLEGPVWARKGE